MDKSEQKKWAKIAQNYLEIANRNRRKELSSTLSDYVKAAEAFSIAQKWFDSANAYEKASIRSDNVVEAGMLSLLAAEACSKASPLDSFQYYSELY